MDAGARAAAAPLDVAGFVERMGPWQDAERLLLAVSGGPDSVALMGLAAAWTRSGGPPLEVATVDHGLRAASRSEAQSVADAAAALGLPHAVLDWPGPPPTSRIQERARTARYALLVAHAQAIGATHLATAHTADDQAETILFRLARGSGVSGLVGMRAQVRRGSIAHVRPLLGVRKAVLVATCRANGWSFIEDPTNADPRFARTRWRGILSSLEPEGLGPERLAAVADRLRRLDAAVGWMAEASYRAAILTRGPDRVVLDAGQLAGVPEEVFLRVISSGLDEAVRHGDARHARLQRLERLCGELQRAVREGRAFAGTLGGALIVARVEGTIVLTREAPRRASQTAQKICRAAH